MSLLDRLIAEDQQKVQQSSIKSGKSKPIPTFRAKTPLLRGRPLRSTADRNCLSCFHYLFCKDPKKRWDYLCSKYVDNKDAGETNDTLMHVFEQWQDTIPQIIKSTITDPVNDDSELIVLVNNIISSGLTAAPDFRIDDRDLPLAPNVWEFFLNPKWIGRLNEEPYAQQMRIALEFYQEFNPRLSDIEFFETMPVDAKLSELAEHISFLEYGRCPKTGVRHSELVRNGELNDYYTAALPIGQRSGKTSISAKMTAYTTHQFMKLSDPASAFKLAKGSWLVGTATAWSYAQCLLSIWQQIHSIFIDKDNWFGRYHQMLIDYGRRYGEQLFNITGRMIVYNHRNLLLMPASPNPDTLRGPTRYVSIIDELGRFRLAKGESAEKGSGGAAKFNGRETFVSLENSLQTLQGMHHTLRMQGDDNIPLPIFLNIGSPSSQLDELMRLYKLSNNSRTIYGLRKATWEVNPHLPRSHFNKQFAENPLHAQANFGADPPMSSAAFIDDIKFLKASVDMNRENAVILQIKRTRTPSGRLYMSGTPIFNSRDKSVAKLMAIDAGFNAHSFSIAVGHNSVDLSSVIVDAILELIPQENLPINHAYLFEDVILPVIRELNVTLVASDRWESLRNLHELERLNIKTERYSLKYIDFNNFREAIFNGEIRTPRPEIQSRDPQEIIRIGQDNYPFGFQNKPCAHYLYQCVTVRDFINQTVLKGEISEDDNFRAVVLLHAYLSDPTYQKEFSGTYKSKMRGVGAIVRPNDTRNIGSSNIGTLIRPGTTGYRPSMGGVYTFATKR